MKSGELLLNLVSVEVGAAQSGPEHAYATVTDRLHNVEKTAANPPYVEGVPSELPMQRLNRTNRRIGARSI